MAVMFLFVNLALFFNNYVNPVALADISWKYYIVYCCWLFVELVVVYFVSYSQIRSLDTILTQRSSLSKPVTLPWRKSPSTLMAMKLVLGVMEQLDLRNRLYKFLKRRAGLLTTKIFWIKSIPTQSTTRRFRCCFNCNFFSMLHPSLGRGFDFL